MDTNLSTFIADDPRFGRLRRLLPKLGRHEALGILWDLNRLTMTQCPDGRLAPFVDDQGLEQSLGWRGPPGVLGRALVTSGWLERKPVWRFVRWRRTSNARYVLQLAREARRQKRLRREKKLAELELQKLNFAIDSAKKELARGASPEAASRRETASARGTVGAHTRTPYVRRTSSGRPPDVRPIRSDPDLRSGSPLRPPKGGRPARRAKNQIEAERKAFERFRTGFRAAWPKATLRDGMREWRALKLGPADADRFLTAIAWQVKTHRSWKSGPPSIVDYLRQKLGDEPMPPSVRAAKSGEKPSAKPPIFLVKTDPDVVDSPREKAPSDDDRWAFARAQQLRKGGLSREEALEKAAEELKDRLRLRQS
jgi:hypothetical protein